MACGIWRNQAFRRLLHRATEVSRLAGRHVGFRWPAAGGNTTALAGKTRHSSEVTNRAARTMGLQDRFCFIATDNQDPKSGTPGCTLKGPDEEEI